MASNLSNEEKRRLSNERQNAVRNAWNEEKARVQQGQGSRDWSVLEQKELLERGAVSGYEGHHMKSVSHYPEHAGNSRNIQFLSEDEHFNGAHQGNFHHATNGYFDPTTNTMHEFEGDELVDVPVANLSEPCLGHAAEQLQAARQEYIQENSRAEAADNAYESLAEGRSAYMDGPGEADSEALAVSESPGIGR